MHKNSFQQNLTGIFFETKKKTSKANLFLSLKTQIRENTKYQISMKTTGKQRSDQSNSQPGISRTSATII